MQIEMIRPSRTNKNNTSENRRVSTISTISHAKDQPQHVRFFAYLDFTAEQKFIDTSV